MATITRFPDRARQARAAWVEQRDREAEQTRVEALAIGGPGRISDRWSMDLGKLPAVAALRRPEPVGQVERFMLWLAEGDSLSPEERFLYSMGMWS